MMQLLSIIIPCYNEEEALPYFQKEIEKILEDMKASFGLTFEVIYINDGSNDSTLKLLRSYVNANSAVKYISFSRNFGKEAAMYAGLQYATGSYVAIMDADMQDPPSLLPQMYAILQEGEYDCVATRRVDRIGEPPIRSFFARCFYKLINKISDADIVDGARDFRLLTRQVVNAIISMSEYNRFSKGIFGWVGFHTKWLPYKNVARVAGETKWSFWKLLKYSLQGITAFSIVPLAISSIFGIISCILALLLAMWIVIKTCVLGDPVSGWPSLACIILSVAGVQLFCMGILGQYLAKTYLETKKRPIYIISETGNIKTPWNEAEIDL